MGCASASAAKSPRPADWACLLYRAAFAELDTSVTETVKFGDGSRVDIYGQGTVLFVCKTGEHRAVTGVYYIPRLNTQIISLGQFDENGCQVLIEDGRAVGVRATVRQADMPAWTLVVRSRVVVAAAGAIGTPALLQRSAVRGKALGAHLRLHPGTAVAGIFEERLNPWEGTMQAIYSDQFINSDGQHHGVKIESGPMHPAILALATPWRDPAHYNRLMRSLPHMSVAAPLVRDHHSGRVTAHQGSARVDYRLSREDVADVRQGIEASARIFEAGGALEIFTSQAAFVSYRPGQRGGLAGFMDEVDRRGYGPGQMSYLSFHQMGSCRMGVDPETSVIGPDHESHAVKGLFVADGSAFPSASGVNPMITIMSMAHRASRFIAAAC